MDLDEYRGIDLSLLDLYGTCILRLEISGDGSMKLATDGSRKMK